jgi:4-hydroxybenzoate polyprenyltransferase
MIATFCGIMMSLIAHHNADLFTEKWPVIIIASITMSLAQMFGQIINQAADPVDLDILNNKSYRPIPRKIISQSTARNMGMIIGIVTLISAFLISKPFGFGISLLLFFALFYSIEPIRAKKRNLLGIGWLGFSRGFLPLPVAWSVFYSPFERLPILLGTVLFFWLSGFQITKDLPDIQGDRQFGIKTFPVVYGIEKSKRFMQWMNGLAFGILLIYLLLDIIPISFIIVFAVFPFGFLVIKRIKNKPTLYSGTENSPEWRFFYIGLAVLYILFTFAMVIA